MKLDLYFEAPMQSWGLPEAWYKTRRTASTPTKSAVAGLISRCMGIYYKDKEDIKKVYDSFEIVDSFMYDNEDDDSYKVINKRPVTTAHRMTDDEVVYIKDYIEAGLTDGFLMGDGGVKSVNGVIVGSQMMQKDYLEDERLGITIEGTYEALSAIRNAILRPHWGPYLGRSCCIQSGPIIRGEIY